MYLLFYTIIQLSRIFNEKNSLPKLYKFNCNLLILKLQFKESQMKKKTLSISLIIIGSYLLIGNTIFSLLFNRVDPIGYYIPVDPLNYWENWWQIYGFMTMIVAIYGLIFIILGIIVFTRNKEEIIIFPRSYKNKQGK